MDIRYVMLRFADDAGVPYQDGIENQLPALLGAKWQAIANEFKDLAFHRVFDVEPVKGTGPGGTAPDDDDPAEPYFQVQFQDADHARRFLARLNALKPAIIAEAYVRAPVHAGHTGAGGGSGSQAYFDAAPRGIDAKVIWEEYEGYGEGVGVAHLDFGWYEQKHDDLPALELMFGKNNLELAYHGTAVLGILEARRGGSSVRGGAAQARVETGSVLITNLNNDNVPGALRRARKRLEHGDIILLEATSNQSDTHGIESAPAEADPITLGEIQRCAEEDILVIAPAGNSNANLKVFGEPPDPPYSLLVGSCAHDGDGGDRRWEGKQNRSNYGKRVNCFAWGHDICTLGEPPRGTFQFDGTSGATAIVAVAAILLQSIAKKQFAALGRDPGFLTPEQLCYYLRSYGTRIDHDPAHPIGVMPDLNVIVTRFLADFPVPGVTTALGAAKGMKAPRGVIRKK